MQEISVNLIEKAIYQMCKEANIRLPQVVYDKIKNAAKYDKQNEFILKNAQIADRNERPLCQDTGQVIVFMSVGQDVHFIGGNINDAINKAVSDCYKENYFRKSVVKDALCNRLNTGDNSPAVIHYEFVSGDEVEIKIMIKGGGSENVTQTRMMTPTSSYEQICQAVFDMVKNAGRNACPPIFVGVGAGQTLENAVLLSKKAILEGSYDENIYELLNNNLEIGFNRPVLDVKKMSASTHIASLPLAVTILCHSNRYNSCVIKNNEIIYTTKLAQPDNIDVEYDEVSISAQNINDILNVPKGKKIMLNGRIYTARDAAHKKIIEMAKSGEKIPFQIQNSILFYAGPCPNTPDEISGPIGPTTSKRMDDFAIELYKLGVAATIGKGERSECILNYLTDSGKKYFEIQGGIASYLANCVKSSRVVAFENFGPEAVYELNVENLPLICVK